ncbi:MAG TPA: putative sulfate exporter family transporter [Gemmatimonadaceae bacterium]|nr:putative sulfate exporter family transporter [Gemmatimonadaceae bacterium]
MVAAVLLALGAIFSLTPAATPALALGAGIAIALAFGNPVRHVTSRVSGRLLQAAVVGLGFGIPLDALVRAGTSGVAITAVAISVVFAAGLALARWLAVERQLAVLITAGTSICGGSAIAALGPAIGAGSEAMGVSLATVFVLNAVALYVFPVVGHLMGLTQHQFGVWAALAIHDTSSVVGAAASYGPVALRDATILKLARALWILPLTLLAPALLHRRSGGAARRTRAPIPWFIGLFVLAAVARSLAPGASLAWFDDASALARTALVLTLFLIGANLTRAQLRTVGTRPLVHGLLLWVGVATVSLAAVDWGVRG